MLSLASAPPVELKQYGTHTAPRKKPGPKLKPNPSKSLLRRRHNDKCAKVGEIISKALAEHDCTFDALINSPYGRKEFVPVSDPQILGELQQIRDNTQDLLKRVGRNAHRGVTGVLIQGLSADARQRHFPGETASYLANARIPSFTTNMFDTQEVFTRDYKSNVTRNIIQTEEVTALLHWCCNVQFSSRSGDTTETYYRVDSKDACYYNHYRGHLKGALLILEHIDTAHPELVEGKTLTDDNLTRYDRII